MARKKATGVFIVTGYQADADGAVPGFEFGSASEALGFATKMHKTAIRLWAKTQEPDDTEARKALIKARSASLGLDVLIQPTDAAGNHVGDPMLYETIGVEDDDTEEVEESEEEEVEEEDDDDDED